MLNLILLQQKRTAISGIFRPCLSRISWQRLTMVCQAEVRGLWCNGTGKWSKLLLGFSGRVMKRVATVFDLSPCYSLPVLHFSTTSTECFLTQLASDYFPVPLHHKPRICFLSLSYPDSFSWVPLVIWLHSCGSL